MALSGSTTVTVDTALTATESVCLVCPPSSSAPLRPYPPTILSIGQASQRNRDGSTTSVLALGLIQNRITGSNPVAQFKIYRGPTYGGPFLLVVDDKPISNVLVVNNLFDSAPIFGAQEFYVATAIDAAGYESDFSNVVSYTASRVSLGLFASALSRTAFGPYPVLGSDCYLDPITREGVIGPNGDLLAVNGLECLAQDLRIRILSEYGELPMHPDFGLSKSKVIGSGQATRVAEAAILVADIKDMLRKEPRVLKTLDVIVNQADPYSWVIGYDIQAIGVEDELHLNLVYPFF